MEQKRQDNHADSLLYFVLVVCNPYLHWWKPRAGSGVVRIDPLRFLARCCTRRLNQVWFLFYILACVIRSCCLLGPLLCIVSFRCYVFCLLVVLVKLSVFAKWLARKTPLWRGDHLQKAQAEECAWFSWFIILLHCFIMYLCCLLSLRDIFSYCYGMI